MVLELWPPTRSRWEPMESTDGNAVPAAEPVEVPAAGYMSDVTAGSGAVVVVRTESGRSQLLYGRTTAQQLRKLELPVRKVGRYGGGFAAPWGSGGVIFVDLDGRIVGSSLDDSGVELERRIWAAEPGPVGCLRPSPNGECVAFIVDDGDSSHCEARTLSGERLGPWALDHDFVLDPTWSLDGRFLAMQVWDDPDMAFVHSKILLVDVLGGGDPILVERRAALSQPRFLPGGERLGFLSNESGTTLPWTVDLDGDNVRPWIRDVGDWGEPTLGPNGSAWLALSDDLAVGVRNEGGFAALVVGRSNEPHAEKVRNGIHTSLTTDGTTVWAIRQGARMPPELVAYDLSDQVIAKDGAADGLTSKGSVSRRTLLRTASDAAHSAVEPEVFSWTAADGLKLDGLLYSPDGPLKAVIVLIHGGPVGQARVLWSDKIRGYLAENWAVFAPNVRGSSGAGRARMEAIAGAWGLSDVADIAAGITSVVQTIGYRPPMFVEGGSSGGLAALMLAARGGEFDGVIAHNPVTDIAATDQRTHRVERHYSQWLVGPDANELELRSPITHVSAIKVPLLITQGDADVSVPASLTRRYVEAARDFGVAITYLELAGEGHSYSPAADEVVGQAANNFIRDLMNTGP